MKANHLSGGVVMVNGDVVKCLRGPCLQKRKDETKLNYLKRLCGHFLPITYGVHFKEFWYGKYKKRCIFEEAFPEAAQKTFKDYKVWVMNNRPMIVEIDASRHIGTHTSDFVTPNYIRIQMNNMLILV